MAIDGDTVAAGAYRDDDGGSDSGSAYVFFEPSGGWVSASETFKLTASDAAANDVFGYSVAVDGDTVVVGAHGDDDAGSASGSAYVFGVSAWAAIGDSAPGGANATSYTFTRVPDGAQYGLRIRAVNSVGVSDATATATLVVPSQPTGLAAAAGNAQATLSWDDPSDSSINGYEYYVRAQIAKLADSNGAADDAFGRSVAVDGDTMVVGAYGDDDAASGSGSVYVFTRQSGVWSQVATLTATDGADDDVFGYSVAVDGDTVAVGAYGDDDAASGSGSVYVFTKPAAGWASASGNIKLTASDAAANDWFGHSVAVDGDTVVVGAPKDDHYSSANGGSAYVFTKPAAGWASASGNVKLTAFDGAASDEFGWSVAVHGDTVAVGAYADDDAGSASGSAYVFTKPAGGWASASGNVKLTASDAAANDWFGHSVAVAGDTVVAGAPQDDDAGSASGSAYVFAKPAAGGWASAGETFKLTANDGAASDEFGYSVAVDGDTVAAGAADAGSGSGSAYVYRASVWAAVADSAPGGANDASYTVAGLTNGAQYGFSVRAHNDRGLSYASAAATAMLFVADQPTGLTATVGDAEATLSWDDPSDSTVTGYEYELQEQGQPAQAWAAVADSATGGANDASHTVAGLTNGTQYSFRVRAVNAVGSSTPSAAATVTLVVADQPTGLAAAAGDTQATLSWDDPSDSTITIAGYEYVLQAQTAKLAASDAAQGDKLGFSVAADGDSMVVGAPGDDDGGSNSGSVYVFTRQSGVWSQAKLTASDAAANDEFGTSVAIDGDTIVVGAPQDRDGGLWSGSVHVFTKPAGGWATATETAKLTASDAAVGDFFGTSVAIDGDTVVVGARGDDADAWTWNSASVYVFTKPAGGWATATETARLTASDAAAEDYFGFTVAVAGDTIVGGAAGDNNGAGSAYVFTKPAGGWASASGNIKLTASDAATYDFFGWSVAVHGDTIVVGAPQNDDAGSKSGSAYVFTEPAGGWASASGNIKLTASDAATYDFFGWSVAVHGDTVIVGAYRDDGSETDSGSAYLFAKPAAGWASAGETAKLTASDAASNDWFGNSVAVDGDTVAVGAHKNDDAATNTGSAYIYQATAWTAIADSAPGGANDTTYTVAVVCV